MRFNCGINLCYSQTWVLLVLVLFSIRGYASVVRYDDIKQQRQQNTQEDKRRQQLEHLKLLELYGKKTVELGKQSNDLSAPISVCCFETNKAEFNTSIAISINRRNNPVKDKFFDSGNGVLEELHLKRDEDSTTRSEKQGVSNQLPVILFVGYADERATDMVNLNLGSARAKAVASVVCKDDQGVFCAGVGKVRPVVMSCGSMSAKLNSNPKEQAMQRRVDVYYPVAPELDTTKLCAPQP